MMTTLSVTETAPLQKHHHHQNDRLDDDDRFDRVPDPLVHLIFNRIADVKTLIRCRAVSKRFKSLVPQADTLLLKVDKVVPAAELDGGDSVFLTFFRSILKSLYYLILPKPLPDTGRSPKSPIQVLRGFDRVRELEIQLPSGDLRPEKGAMLRWRAEFGKTLRSCVILGCRATVVVGHDGEVDLEGGGLKTRVVWTISSLIAASARHWMLRDLVKQNLGLERLVVRDREEEGTLVIEKDGLTEYRLDEEEEDRGFNGCDGAGGMWWRVSRTTVPSVRMRMRHEPRLELSGGIVMEGATLVVVRPTSTSSGAESEAEEQCLASGAFKGVYSEAVEKLLTSRSCLLEMNSF